jgi:hypothetical protein
MQPKSYEIPLTEFHIRTGLRGSPYSCPVANALRGTFSATGNISVGHMATTILLSPDHFMVIDHALEVQRWITRFDGGVPFLNMPAGTLVVNESGVDSMGTTHARMEFNHAA